MHLKMRQNRTDDEVQLGMSQNVISELIFAQKNPICDGLHKHVSQFEAMLGSVKAMCYLHYWSAWCGAGGRRLQEGSQRAAFT